MKTAWHIKSRPTHRNQDLYIAWAAREPLTTDDPHTEPQRDVWFEFGDSEANAIAKLKSKLPNP